MHSYGTPCTELMSDVTDLRCIFVRRANHASILCSSTHPALILVFAMAANIQAAPPILASVLLTTAEAEERSLRMPASCGLVSVDDMVLDGGFRYGEITSIAGATATGKTLVCPSITDC